MKIRHLSLRIDDELLKKFRYISEFDGRSANNEILMLIKNCIREFEDKNGKIEIIDNMKDKK